MKFKVLLVTVMLLALCVCACAQGPGGGGGNRQQMDRVGPVVKDLGLTEAQITSIREIVTKFRTDSRPIMQGEGTDAEKQTKVDALKATATTGIKAVLTEAKVEATKQDEVVKALLERRTRGGAGGPGGVGGPSGPGGPGGFMQRLLDQLDLTADQKTKIEALQKTNQEAVKAINDDTTLTPEAKRPKLNELRTKLMTDIKAVLTPEQITKLDELMKARTRPAQQQTPPAAAPATAPPAP